MLRAKQKLAPMTNGTWLKADANAGDLPLPLDLFEVFRNHVGLLSVGHAAPSFLLTGLRDHEDGRDYTGQLRLILVEKNALLTRNDQTGGNQRPIADVLLSSGEVVGGKLISHSGTDRLGHYSDVSSIR